MVISSVASMLRAEVRCIVLVGCCAKRICPSLSMTCFVRGQLVVYLSC
jgi:hypothetical protein